MPGVVGNSEVPNVAPGRVAKDLAGLKVNVLWGLVRLWFGMEGTRPNMKVLAKRVSDRTLDTEINEEGSLGSPAGKKVCDTSLGSILDMELAYLTHVRDTTPPTAFKRRLIDAILVDYYPQGLNALQLAQIDVQTLIERPAAHSWASATVRCGAREEIAHFDPQAFLNAFVENLNALYNCHVYVARHPRYPMHLVRVQVYEEGLGVARRGPQTHSQFTARFASYRANGSSKQKRSRPQYVHSLRAHYMLIPLSTPSVIYTAPAVEAQALVSQPQPFGAGSLPLRLMLQTLEKTLSTPTRPVSLHHEGPTPLRNLNALFIVKANSRFANAHGPWTPYADNTVDSNVLSPGTDNFRLNPSKIVGDPTDVATIRFRGSTEKIHAKRLYDTVEAEEEFGKENEADPDESDSAHDSDAPHVVPVDQFSHTLMCGATISFVGTDTLGGLLELAKAGILDPVTCPSWITGENLKL